MKIQGNRPSRQNRRMRVNSPNKQNTATIARRNLQDTETSCACERRPTSVYAVPVTPTRPTPSHPNMTQESVSEHVSSISNEETSQLRPIVHAVGMVALGLIIENYFLDEPKFSDACIESLICIVALKILQTCIKNEGGTDTTSINVAEDGACVFFMKVLAHRILCDAGMDDDDD